MHWTQKPENKAKLAKIVAKANRGRKAMSKIRATSPTTKTRGGFTTLRKKLLQKLAWLDAVEKGMKELKDLV
jgi:hypothetical protein